MPLILSYDQWIKSTSRLGLIRSAELKAVDRAYSKYETSPGPEAKRELQEAFEAWKRKEGPGNAWLRSARNATGAVSMLDAYLKGIEGDNETAFSAGRIPEYMHAELINARLGVLYLFSRISVSAGLFKLFLEGGLNIASQTLKVAGADETVRHVFTGLGKASPVLGQGLNALEKKKIAPKNAPHNIYLPEGAKPSIIAGETATWVVSEQILQDAKLAEQLASRSTAQKIKDKLREWFDFLLEKIKETLREKFTTVEGVVGVMKDVTSGILSLVAASAVPFFRSADTLVTGVARVIKAAVDKFRCWKLSKGVDVNPGYPQTIVQSITGAMTLSLFEGLYSSLKGAATLATDIVAVGAGAFVNLLISASELLIKFCWRLVEGAQINAFCKEAREHWNRHLSSDSIHLHPFAFGKWYRSYALNIPVIAILTLNSGICGDKMRYLTLFESGERVITSEKFQHGVRFLDNLKAYGSEYLKRCGFDFIVHSNDALVHSLVNEVAFSHSVEKTRFEKFLKVVGA